MLWLTAAQAGAATLTVAWDAVPDASVAGYVLYWGTQSGAYISSVDVGSQTERQLTTLAAGTTYYFVVRAYNAARSLGNPSREVSASTLSASGPSIVCPAPIKTSLDGKPVAVILTPTVGGGTAPVSSSCLPQSGSLFPVGTTTVTCSAVDALKKTATCSSQVVVKASTPTTAPLPLTIACPAPSVVSTNGARVAVALTPKVSGGLAPIQSSCTPVSGSTFAVGKTAFTCTALDAARHTATCTSQVTVTTPPPAPAPPRLSLTCPAPTVVSTNGRPIAVPLAPRPIGGVAPYQSSCSPPSGSAFAVGRTPITCVAVDAAKQTASCTSQVVVTVPPPPLTITCPTPYALSNGGGVALPFTPRPSGGVYPVQASCTPGSGSTFPIGTTPLTCTAIDAVRQVATCKSNVYVIGPIQTPYPYPYYPYPR